MVARAFLASAAAVALGACASFEVSDPDPAGPDGGGGGKVDADGAPTGDGTSLTDQLCQSSAAGELNPAGATIAPTGTYSNWFWPASAEGFDSIEWLIGIEDDPSTDGYYWAHTFGFAGEGAGHAVAGIQAHGLYNADPPDGPIELAKMTVFMIYGGVLDAELGDIAYPDARIHPDGDAWWSIFDRYQWVPCRMYRMRVSRVGTEEDGGQWFGAFLTDTETGVETDLGRMRVPAAWRGIASASITYTQRFGFDAMADCSDQEYASAIFGIPTGNGGTIPADQAVDRFYDPTACPSSRFTRMPGGVRHEMGVGGD